MNDTLDLILKEVRELRKLLLGNGGEGLVVQVTRHDERLKDLEETRRPWRNIWPQIVSGVLIALVAAAVIAWVN